MKKTKKIRMIAAAFDMLMASSYQECNNGLCKEPTCVIYGKMFQIREESLFHTISTGAYCKCTRLCLTMELENSPMVCLKGGFHGARERFAKDANVKKIESETFHLRRFCEHRARFAQVLRI